MNRAESSVALNALLSSKTRADVTAALTRLSSRGDQKLKWRDLGDRDTNFATVHVTSNPMVSVVERITNAIDATFEKVAEDRPEFKSIRSPRVFADKALGFKEEVLPDTIKRRRKATADDTGVVVNLWDGDSDAIPTLEIIDTGIGLTRKEIPETILSLNKSNKITKWYLMGRFGQGGSTTFAFCEYTIIISRKHIDNDTHASNNNEFAFTIVKYQEPSHDEKDGKYVFLVSAEDNLPLVGVLDKPLESHFSTLVRHINFRMGKQSLLTLYGKLEYYLFDPVIPFKMINQKVGPYQERLRTIYGSRDRLSRTPLVEKKEEVVIPSTSDVDYGTIKLRYWLFVRGTDTSQKETFIETDNPIVVTYYGQAHSMYPRRFLADCNLPYLQRDLVIQIDCDLVNDAGRRVIFSSTRETTTTEGTSFIKRLLVETLANNKELRQLNRQREEASLTEGFTKEREEMRQTLAEMINRILPGRITVKGGDKGEGDKKPASVASSREPDLDEQDEELAEQRPIPIKQFPTFIQIINKQDPLVFRANQSKRIEIVTDAPNEFLEQNGAYFNLDPTTERFVRIVHYQHDIYFGRIFITAKLKDNVPIGTEFEFKIQLNAIKPSSAEKVVFQDKREANVEAPNLKKPNQSKIQTDAPYPEVVDKNHEYYIDNKWTETNVAEVVKSQDKIVIYVSVENEWYQAAIRNSKYTESARQTIKNKYVLLTAFYAYLQDDAAEHLTTDAEKQLFEKVGQSQLEAAARTVLTALTSEKAFEIEKLD